MMTVQYRPLYARPGSEGDGWRPTLYKIVLISHKVSSTRDGNAERRRELFRGRPRRSGASVSLN